jgi:mannose-6-phosphate isomerase-like protein (cupin superfamily)
MPQPASRIALADALTAPLSLGRSSALLFAHGSLEVRWYAPHGIDSQTVHVRDEVYVVVTGEGWFMRAGERVPFAAGDTLFVRAGVPHRFEDFSEGFGAWIIYYGPEGGEQPPSI